MQSGERVVSIDLAYKRYSDIGVCVLARDEGFTRAEYATFGGAGAGPTPEAVAEHCIALCERVGSRVLLVDGPAAWRDPTTDVARMRICERRLNTPAKTGLPGSVLPRNYLPFVAFSIAVFDALHERGWPRIESGDLRAGRCAIEVFPRAAWLRLGRRSLPAKSKCRPETVAEFHAGLVSDFSIHDQARPTHDELQALVAGIAGLALVERDRNAYELVGEAPRLIDGSWREGFILAPRQRTSDPQLRAHSIARR